MISISFIIPYYNLEKELLLRAVDSIALAHLDCDYEIIVIDDGTPNSHAEEWLSGKPCVCCFRQDNGGLSAARNTGISLATKDYIQFLDGDDYLFPSAYRKMVDMLQREQPDILLFRHKKISSQGITDKIPKAIGSEHFSDGIDYMLNRNIFAGVWSYVFKRQTLGNLRFVPGIFHEDEDFTPRLLTNSGKVIAIDAVCYAYYQRQGSIINNSNGERLAKRFNDIMQILKRMKQSATETGDLRLRQAYTRRINQLALGILYTALTDLPSVQDSIGIAGQLATEGLWPLPKARYTRRYRLFRRLTDRRWKLRIMKFLLKRR